MAGWKRWDIGEVVEAGDLQNYIQDQTVQVYATSAARGSALGTAVTEGMISYRTDENALEMYNGSSWQLVGAYSPNYIINGAFEVNQRNFTSITASSIYGHDRWNTTIAGDGTATYTPQTFTPGAAPVAGYEGTGFARFVTSGQTSAAVRTNWTQQIEDVRTLAGQTATISFFARAGSGTPKMSIELVQSFGAGGSSSVFVDGGRVTLSTSWQRFSATVSVPSISGKTIGGNTNALGLNLWVSGGSNFDARIGAMGIQNNTFDIWGVQLEEGSVATPFRRNANSLQGELAACQRYYWRYNHQGSAVSSYSTGLSINTSTVYFGIQFPVTMRTIPTSIEFSGGGVSSATTGFGGGTFSLILNASSTTSASVAYTHTSAALTSDRAYLIQQTPTTGYIAFQAEL